MCRWCFSKLVTVCARHCVFCVSSIIVLGNSLFTKTNRVVVLLRICCGRSQYELFMSQGITFTISVTKMLIEFQLCIYLTSPTSTFNLQRNQILKYCKQSKQQQYRYFGSIFGILYYSENVWMSFRKYANIPMKIRDIRLSIILLNVKQNTEWLFTLTTNSFSVFIR